MSNELAQQLESETIGCRLSFHWLGDKKNVDDSQNADVAARFGASVDAVQTAKRLLDPKRPELYKVNQVKNKTRRFWESETMPHVFRGVRLMKRANVELFAEKMRALELELAERVAELDVVFDDMKRDARQRLGALYNPADYPATLAGAYRFRFDFPNLSVPDYLAELSPELFRRESERIRSAFAESQQLAETLFQTELARIVEHITETLTTTDANGRPKIFRDSLTGNLQEFLQRFQRVSVGNSAELSALVERARNALQGVNPQALRDSANVRQLFVDRMRTIQTEIDNGTETQNGRRIRNAQQTQAPAGNSATVPADDSPQQQRPTQADASTDAGNPADDSPQRNGRVFRRNATPTDAGNPATVPADDSPQADASTDAETQTDAGNPADDSPQQQRPTVAGGRMRLQRFAVA